MVGGVRLGAGVGDVVLLFGGVAVAVVVGRTAVGSAFVAVAVGLGKAGSQIVWPILNRIVSRQLTCCNWATVVLVACPRADSESFG
jgi:hypothetical protein